MAETFGDLAGGWQPVNETNYYARAAYGGGGWPPGANDREQVAFVDEAIQLATAEAALRLRQTGTPVSSIFGLSYQPEFRPLGGRESLRVTMPVQDGTVMPQPISPMPTGSGKPPPYSIARTSSHFGV